MARLFDDGSSEYLEIASAVVSSPPFAVSAWVYPDDVTSELTIFCLGDSAVHGEYWKMVVRGNVSPASITFQAGSKRANTSTGVTVNTWHHGCGIEAASTDRRAFLDGGSKGTNAVLQTPTPDRTAIGRECDSTPGFHFSGRLAEVAVWDLSNWPGATDADKADEFERVAVPALAAGFSPAFFMLGLVAYWSLIRDEDQDRVGGYDLTPYNAPGIAAHPPMIYPASAMLGLAAAIGGTTFYETPVGTLTSSAVLARLIATTKAGGLTPSGAIVRQTAAMKAGALGPAGVTARQTATSKAGAFTSSGSLVRQAQKAVAGALSSAGALVRQGQKAAAGTLSSAGAVIKQKATTLVGTLTTSGALSTIRTFLRTVLGTLSTSGELARQTGKSVAGTLSSAGAVVKQKATMLVGTLTTSGALSTIRTFLRTVLGTLSTSGALARQTGKSVAGTLSSAGAVIKRVAKSLAGALGLAGVLARYLLGWVPGDQTVTCLIVTETVTGEVTGVSVTGEVTEVAVTDEVV